VVKEYFRRYLKSQIFCHNGFYFCNFHGFLNVVKMGEKVFPIRKDVEWEVSESNDVVISMMKDLSSFETKISDFLGAPKVVRRPLDEMNSKLWILMDGTMSLDEIIDEMNEQFAEKIAPVSERVTRSIAEFVQLGLVVLKSDYSSSD